MRVVGLDLSLSSTGVAMPSGLRLVRPADKVKGEERLVLIRDLVLQCVCGTGPDLAEDLWHDGADVVVIEGYSFGSKFSRGHAAGELGGVVRVALHEEGIPFAVVPPTTLKKYACGSGAAKKEAVLVQAVKRFGLDFESSDTADAHWLRAMGMDQYGEPIAEMPKDHRLALASVQWPELAPAMEEAGA